MKKLTLVLLTFFISIIASAQDNDTSAIYVKNPIIPPFKLYTVPDSAVFTKESIKKKKQVMVMIFSPECDHCLHQIQEILDNIEVFKNIQVVMASPLPYNTIKSFYETYHLDSLPNFHVGYDQGYKLNEFYKVRNFPSMYLYDKKGKFITRFSGNATAAQIQEAFNKAK